EVDLPRAFGRCRQLTDELFKPLHRNLPPHREHGNRPQQTRKPSIQRLQEIFPILSASGFMPPLNSIEPKEIPGFRFVPRTGVIYVMHEAMAQGFSYDDPNWANLGQGSPETGPLPNAPARIDQVLINPTHQQYAPVAGNKDLCQAVADFYNAVYRKDKSSKYTGENVIIASGGTRALTRLPRALGHANKGSFNPYYTAPAASLRA